MITHKGLENWFALRLQFLGFVINLTAIGYSIFNGSDDASILGLLLTYSMNLNGEIIATSSNFAFSETQMVSVERVRNFTKLEP